MTKKLSSFTFFYYKIRMYLILDGTKRAEFLKKSNIFKEFGENVHFQPFKLPRDPQMIKIHNNVRIASGVTFITHDGINKAFNLIKPNSARYHLNCIEIMNNVVIGSNSIIMYDVKLGNNVIVAAGSVVTKDVPDGKIVGGSPAKVIGEFKNLQNKRNKEKKEFLGLNRQEYINKQWEKFDEKRLNRYE